MIRNILLTIKYDGTEFSGWQRQPHVPTVQAEIERVLGVLCADDIEINGTSRTDAGVHALGQRANFLGEFAIPTENIKRAANSMLDPAIQITEVREVELGFHARFDCKGKTYEYRIHNGRECDPFRRNYCYFVNIQQLDTEKMKEAAGYISGTHDFKCFQASGSEEKKTTVRTISAISVETLEWTEEMAVPDESDSRWFAPKDITIRVTGDGFLYNMVRIIAGTLVDVGLGRLDPEDVKEAIESLDRRKAGHTAPPQGLYLKEIYFE